MVTGYRQSKPSQATSSRSGAFVGSPPCVGSVAARMFSTPLATSGGVDRGFVLAVPQVFFRVFVSRRSGCRCCRRPFTAVFPALSCVVGVTAGVTALGWRPIVCACKVLQRTNRLFMHATHPQTKGGQRYKLDKHCDLSDVHETGCCTSSNPEAETCRLRWLRCYTYPDDLECFMSPQQFYSSTSRKRVAAGCLWHPICCGRSIRAVNYQSERWPIFRRRSVTQPAVRPVFLRGNHSNKSVGCVG